MISLRNFFITFLIALLVFGICAYYITGFVVDSVQGLMSGENVTEKVDDENDDGPSNADEVITPVFDDIDGESFNILLVGTDYRPSLYKDYHPSVGSQYPMFASSEKLIGHDGKLPEYPYRTVSADAIVLVCVNKTARTVACINLPSDMNVDYRGGETRLGDLYYEMGFDVFKNKISSITGAEIDYYALTSIESIVGVVNKIGPVAYNVPCDMNYADEENGLVISLSAGAQSIDGKAAADMLSFDSYTDGANSRAKTTLSFLVTLAKKMTAPSNYAAAATIFGNISQYVTTNVTSNDLLDNIDLVFSLSEGFEFVKIEYPVNVTGKPNINLGITNIAHYIDK